MIQNKKNYYFVSLEVLRSDIRDNSNSHDILQSVATCSYEDAYSFFMTLFDAMLSKYVCVKHLREGDTFREYYVFKDLSSVRYYKILFNHKILFNGVFPKGIPEVHRDWVEWTCEK